LILARTNVVTCAAGTEASGFVGGRQGKRIRTTVKFGGLYAKTKNASNDLPYLRQEILGPGAVARASYLELLHQMPDGVTHDEKQIP